MSNLPVFLNGSEVLVEIGGVPVVECQAISWQDSVNNQLSFGMGDYSASSNEPLMITGGGGTVRVLRYSSAALALQGQTGLDGRKLTSAVQQQVNTLRAAVVPAGQDGNSLAFASSFSPAQLLLETTFDMKVYVRTSATEKKLAYVLKDCIMSGWSLSFAMGGVANEDYSFICRLIQDVTAEPNKLTNNP
jgi:hypothetical protein